MNKMEQSEMKLSNVQSAKNQHWRQYLATAVGKLENKKKIILNKSKLEIKIELNFVGV